MMHCTHDVLINCTVLEARQGVPPTDKRKVLKPLPQSLNDCLNASQRILFTKKNSHRLVESLNCWSCWSVLRALAAKRSSQLFCRPERIIHVWLRVRRKHDRKHTSDYRLGQQRHQAFAGLIQTNSGLSWSSCVCALRDAVRKASGCFRMILH